MIQILDNSEDFRVNRNKAWEQNANYWLKHWKMATNIQLFIKERIREKLRKGKTTIIDIGCGNGWIWDLIQDLEDNIEYIGVDTNPYFIEYLNQTNVDAKTCEFICADIEKEVLNKFIEKVDIVICSLSLIEMPELYKAYKQIQSYMKYGAILCILTLHPLMQILRLHKNDTLGAYTQDIVKFRNEKNLYFYEKEMSFETQKPSPRYYGILHPINRYMEVAKSVDLRLITYTEMQEDNPAPDANLYVYIEFQNVNII